MSTALRPVVFLDRDGTLNEEIGYIRDVDKLALIEGAAQAVSLLNKSDVAAVLTTNQSGAARGYFDEAHIHRLNERLVNLLAAGGAHLDDVYYCPHLAEGVVKEFSLNCLCRKPAPGMVQQALKDHPEFDAGRVYVVGDKATDVELAVNCSGKGVLVTTGYGEDVLAGTYQWKVKPDHVAPDIQAAVAWILQDLGLA